MSFSDVYENRILDLLLRGTGFAVGLVHIGLGNIVVDADTGITIPEPSLITSPDYQRVALSNAYWQAASLGGTTNVLAITFPEALTAWGLVTHFAILNSGIVGQGDMVLYGTLATPMTVTVGSIPRFDPGDLIIDLD
jgi:hypothetical protein